MNARNSAYRAFRVQLGRELRIARRRRGEWLHPLLFLVLVFALFPLALTPLPALLQQIAPALLWVAVTLSTLLAIPNLFARDHADGNLEQLLLSPHPTTLLLLAKVLAHWLLHSLPIVLLAPLLAQLLLHLPAHAIAAAYYGLLLGTPTLYLLGGVIAALTLTRRGSLLTGLLILPLYAPTLIFGAAAVRNAALGLDSSGQLLLLGAFSLLAIALAPLAMLVALRAALD